MTRIFTAVFICFSLLATAACTPRNTRDVNGAEATGPTNDDAAGGADN